MNRQTPKHDYYRILGIPKSASVDEIKHAYRRLARIYHPDKAGDDTQIVLINEAYTTLKDPIKRANYDALHTVHFSMVGRVVNKVEQELQKSPTVMANLQKFEIKAHHFVRRAERHVQELHQSWQQGEGVFKNAKVLFAKAGTIIRQMDKASTPYSTKPQHVLPILIISPTIAQSGGTVVFHHGNRTIRTTLPQGLADGSQIKLTINGVAVWFMIKVEK